MELEIASRPELVGTEKGEGFDMFLWDPIPYRSRNTVTLGGENASYPEISVLPDTDPQTEDPTNDRQVHP